MNESYSAIKDNFTLLKEIKRLIVYSDAYIYTNFPKVKKHLKIGYFDCLNDLFKNILRANYTTGSIRAKYQIEGLVNVSYLDFYINYLYDLKIITSRRYSSALRILNNIKKLLYGWLNETKK